MNDEAAILLEETGRWRARDVKYWGGRWDRLRQQLPTFSTEEFRVNDDSPPNPYLRVVVRQPSTPYEKPIPVGVVSNNYTLAQHGDVAAKCFEGINEAGVATADLDCELGLSEFGEWMNLRLYFPDRYNFIPYDDNPIRLRLECVNSVDGSSRLVILLSWLRVICTNGMVVRETKTEIRDIHNERLNVDRIPAAVRAAMTLVEDDVRRLNGWQEADLEREAFERWINQRLPGRWGKKAACRVFHICTSGYDVEYADPFTPGQPTQKPIKQTRRVPGAPDRAKNLYDVSQAMSWVATSRTNAEERMEWQANIPVLIDELAAA